MLDPIRYGVIAADPPWQFATFAEVPFENHSRSVNRHYPTMSLPLIKALPVADYAARNCVLFLWVPDTHLDRAFEVITAWGFKYKTVAFHWVKTNRCSPGYFTGCGWWTRANAEICLLATRGRPKRQDNSVRRLVVSPRREHSRKPDAAYDGMRRLVAGPYLELFARTRRPGWDVAISNEADRFSVHDKDAGGDPAECHQSAAEGQSPQPIE